jgi:hypothetical protein
VTSWNSDIQNLWVRAWPGKPDSNEKDRKRPMSPEEKTGIVLNVAPIARAFKANVLQPLKSLTQAIDDRSKNIRQNLRQKPKCLSRYISDGLYTSSPFVHRSSAFGWSATRPSTLHSEPPQK